MDVKSKIKKNFHNIFSLVKNIWSIVNVPNVLTFVRIILIIPFSLEIMNENYSKSLKILMISGITDAFDGFFARLLKQETKFGKILDPFADKLTLISVMFFVSVKFPKIIPFTIALISKEILMLLAGMFMIKKYNNTIKAKWYGKLGTAFFYISILLIVAIKSLWNIENEFVINVLMSITSLLMSYALIRSFLNLRRLSSCCLSIRHNF